MHSMGSALCLHDDNVLTCPKGSVLDADEGIRFRGKTVREHLQETVLRLGSRSRY